MLENSLFQRQTKKYIIDVLHAFLFSNDTAWDGQNQFDLLPILKKEEFEYEYGEQRGCLLVHDKTPTALRLLVSKLDSGRTKVCYRITNLGSSISLDNPKKTCYPLSANPIDFSISDLNFGADDLLSLCFSDNKFGGSKMLYNLLKFLLDSHPVLLNEDLGIFDNILIETLSWPPCAGDKHFLPIFGIIQND